MVPCSDPRHEDVKLPPKPTCVFLKDSQGQPRKESSNLVVALKINIHFQSVHFNIPNDMKVKAKGYG